MFSNIISGLTLTSQVAEGLFQNISGSSYMKDETFVATLRALLYKRVSKEESIHLSYSTSSYSSETVTESTPRSVVRAYLRGSAPLDNKYSQLHIHSFKCLSEDMDANFDVLDRGGVTATFGPSFVELSDVTVFLKQAAGIRAKIYISEEFKSALIFIERLTSSKLHVLQSVIPRYLPWFFKDDPLTEEDTALLRSLTQKDSTAYMEIIEEIAKKFDFRSEYIRKHLQGFEHEHERQQLRYIRNELRENENQLENLEELFRNLYVKKEELVVKELGLIAKINNTEPEAEDSELITYFLCNKSLHLVSVNNGCIEFIVSTVVSNYDPEIVDNALDKVGRSFFYRHYEDSRRYQNKEMTDERIQRLIKAIFVDEIMKLRVCAAYRLDFSDGTYRGLKNYDFPAVILKDHTPNQHIQHYACLGNNGIYVRKAMNEHNYVGAITACCASASNCNFTESNTGSFLMEKVLANDAGAMIQMPDGSTATPLEAVRWLETQNA